MTEKAKAHCLCGAVRFAGHITGNGIQACHCKQCQRWTGGGPLMTVRVTDLETEGADSICSYQASAHGERAFCKVCGTTLYWKLKDRKIAFLPIGLFEDQTGLTMQEEIFVDHRPDWLPAWCDAKQHKEAEMLAQLDAFLEGDAQ
ncbi:MAG: GFA family protein [Roseobacter sp.]